MHYVYILYGPSLDRFYIGETANPDERMAHHQAGDQRYTRRAADWTRVFLKSIPSRTEALTIEQSIKRSKSRKSITRWIQGPDNLISPAVWQLFSW